MSNTTEPLNDYEYYTEGKVISLLIHSFSQHHGNCFITSEQKMNIISNLAAANNHSSFWWPPFVSENAINFAGKEVTKEEALCFAVREKEEEIYNLCANYITCNIMKTIPNPNPNK